MKDFFTTILYQPLYNLLVFFAWLVPGHSIGWAIIILTVVIRVILLPSSIKASKAQVKMQALQPKINKLRKEVKNQQEQGRALMELYKREGVSPWGSCLPLLIQLPILIVLYRVFQAGLDEASVSMLYSFTPHIDKLNPMFFGFDLSKPDLWILPLLAGGTQFVLSLLTFKKMKAKKAEKDEKKDGADPMQMMNKQMIYFFPLFTVFIARSLPSALSIYWIVTTLFSIGQQIYVNKEVEKEREKVAANEGEEEESYEPPKEEVKSDKKKDFMTRIMNKKLEKQAKKTGVEVTIRKKK